MASLNDIETLLKKGEFAKALTLAKAAARRKPKDPAALDILARAYAASKDSRLALATYGRLVALLPTHIKPLADKAHLMQELGDLQGAELNLRKALTFAKTNGVLLRMLSATAKLKPDDPVVGPILSAWKAGTLSTNDRMHAGFAFGAIFADERFTYLSDANDLQRKAFPWSISDRRSEVERLQTVFDDMARWPKVETRATGKSPIFVTGMPRSGTTLVEQILSQHPDVSTTGETGLSLRAAYSVLIENNAFKAVSGLSAKELALIGERYEQGIAHFHRPARAIYTDKSIQTYLVIGLLHHIMRDAKFIVVRRDPRDVGLSIYRNYFEGGTHGYSNSLTDIGHYMLTMEAMVEFWCQRCPDAFIEVHYEDLVTEPEPAVRRILEYCDLDWNEACLSPQDSNAAVKTLSVGQVRAPINAKSVGGWRKYETELAPLIEALQDGPKA